MQENQIEEQFDLKNYENKYTITRTGIIKNKLINKIVKQSLDKKGYIMVWIQDSHQKLHQLLAKQFIENINNYNQIDHINGIKTDNRLENLRWCTGSQNQKNKNGHVDLFQFINQLPEDAVEVEFYSGHQVQDYYYSQIENKMYFNNGVRIRILIPRYHGNSLVYLCNDIKIYLTRLQKGLFNNDTQKIFFFIKKQDELIK